MTASEASIKQFSIEEANRTLPLVKLIVRDIAELHMDLRSRRERLDDLTAGRRRVAGRDGDPYADELRQMEYEFADDKRRFDELIDELRELGVQVSDPASGTVVFPGREETLLAWKLGDTDVRLEQPDHTLNLYTPPESSVDSDGMPGTTC